MNDLPRVHVHMTVSDLDKSRDFYTRFFGVAPVKEKPGYVKFLPGFGPLNLALSASNVVTGRPFTSTEPSGRASGGRSTSPPAGRSPETANLSTPPSVRRRRKPSIP